MSLSTAQTPTHQRTKKLSTPPGPGRFKTLSSTSAFQKHPLEFLADLMHRYGDISQFHLLGMPIVVINHPDYVKQVQQDKAANYDKNALLFKVARPLLGNGLVSAIGGESWLRQRRLIQPAFHRQRIESFGTIMTDATLHMLERWEQRPDKHAPLEISEEMTQITLQIVCKALLNIDDFSEQANVFSHTFVEVGKLLADFIRMPFPPLTVPTPSNQRLWKQIHRLDAIVYSLIKQRRQDKEDVGDLLSMLLQAVDEETGEGMDNQQLRDEVITLLLAGHETSANALSWTSYLLAKHPEEQQQLLNELDQVLNGRTPTMKDIPQLTYTRMVVDEALRLYAPSWQLMRRTCQNDEMGGYRIPANSLIFWSLYLLHRHPDFWERPEEFYPEHFLPEKIASRPRHAYVPFSSGQRICIGNSFALTEIVLILAMILQRYRLEEVPEHKVGIDPALTLRPANGVLVRLEPR